MTGPAPKVNKLTLFGMTLMELLVVLSVIAVIVGMSVPALTRYSGQARLKATVRQFVGLVSLARSLSIGSQAGHTVAVDGERHLVTVVDNATNEPLDHTLRLPKGVALQMLSGSELADPIELVFQPNGTLRGQTAQVSLSDGQKTYTIVVSAMTGAVTVQ